MNPISALIIGHWKTKAVWINGKCITLAGFARDLTEDEQETGDNQDILKECTGVRHFIWGDTSQATYCLSLACCFYLNVKWVMSYFFKEELEKAPQMDLRLEYDNDTLEAGYQRSEDQFAHEFTSFMDELGAMPIDGNDDSN